MAQRVADSLHIPFYDKAVIDLAAKETGLSEEFIRQAEQKKTSSFLYNLYMSAHNLPVTDQVFIAESEVIRKVAGEGPCVIVGRCADYVLRERKDLLSVFIHAPLSFRAQRAQKVYEKTASNIEDFCEEKGQEAGGFLQLFLPE